MSMYEPLRESFRELNRLLTDRQQFNAEQTAREGQEKRNDMMLASRLEDQAFNRVMAEKRINMQQDLNEEQQADADRRHQLMLDKFDWEQEKGKAQLSIDEQIQNRANQIFAHDLQIKRVEKDKALREHAEMQDMEAQKPAATVLEGFFDSEMMKNNPEAMNDLAREVWGEEARYDVEQGFTAVGGEPLSLSKDDARRMAPSLIAFQAKYDETPSRTRKNINKINNEMKTVTNKLNSMHKLGTDDVRFQSVGAGLRLKKSELERQLYNESQKLTPESVLERLENKQRVYNQKIAWAGSVGAKNLAVKWDKDAREVGNRIEALEKEMGKPGKAAATQQRFAVRFDKDGNIMETRLLNTLKTMPGGMLPATYGTPENPMRSEDGWKWMQGSKMAQEMGYGSGDKRWKQGYDVIKDFYGKVATLTGNWEVHEGKRNEFQTVMRIYNKMLKTNKKEIPGSLADSAMRSFQNAKVEFVNTLDGIAQQLDERGISDEKEALLLELRQKEIEDFKEAFGFIPEDL